MITALTFNEISFTPVTHQNSLWIRAVELAHALGYKRPDILTKLYTQNADEFTPDMTQVIEIVDNTESVFPVKARIFSLRGCHLLAMFARTPVAKAFRRWVLDVLDRLAAEERATLPEVPHIKITPSTAMDRSPLRSVIHTWSHLSGLEHHVAYAIVRHHLGLAKFADIPKNLIPETIAWVQTKIDALQTQKNALPPSSEHTVSDVAAALTELSSLRELIRELPGAIASQIRKQVGELIQRDEPKALTPANEALLENADFSGENCSGARHTTLEQDPPVPSVAEAAPAELCDIPVFSTERSALPMQPPAQAETATSSPLPPKKGESAKPDCEYVSCRALMKMLGFRSYDSFCNFTEQHIKDLMNLPCGTRHVLAFGKDGQDLYHRDMATVLLAAQGKQLDPTLIGAHTIFSKKKARRPRGILFMEDVIKLLKISRSQIYRLVRRNLFPKPSFIIHAGKRRHGWNRKDLQALLNTGLQLA